MEDKVSDVDLTLNRTNIALARSTKVIQSWLPSSNSPTAREDDEPTLYDLENADDDEAVQPDNAGIGSTLSYDSSGGLAGTVHRKKIASDKFLEQLFGRQAGQVKKRLQEPGKSMSAKKHAAPKPLADRPKPSRETQSDDEDEGGRSAAFKSRKARPAQQAPYSEPPAEAGDVEGAREVDEDPEGRARMFVPDGAASRPVHLQTDGDKPAKKRGNSYLDELLAHKAKKSKKKKSKQTTDS